ncbi:hypothetical protein [Eubacterium sp.]
MKKTSKKLLSFFLAVVMIVTSCSVGFTAFAEDKKETTADSYWNDVTSAEGAFDAIGGIIDYALPQILNAEIDDNGKKVKIYEKLGVKPDATLQDVIAAASPLLLNLLGGSKSSTDLKTFITSHSSVTSIDDKSWKDSYAKYFGYLTDPNPKAGDFTFIELYTFCEKNTDNSNEDVKKYATETLAKLNDVLKIACRAITDESTAPSKSAMEAFKKILNANSSRGGAKISKKITSGITVEAINNLALWNNRTQNFKLNDVVYKSVAATAADPDVAKGIAEANRALKASGSTVTVSTPAEALVYYYVYFMNDSYGLYDPYDGLSRIKLTYQQAIEYVRLAQKGGSPIKVGGVKLTTANCEETVKKYLAEQKATGNALYANYAEGLEYRYLPKAVFLSMNDLYCQDALDALWDGEHNGVKVNAPWTGEKSRNSLDAFASSSYEAINKALLMESGLTEEEALKKIDEAKFTDETITNLWNDAKKYDANAEDSPKFKAYLISDNCTYLNAYQKAFFRATESLNDNDFYIIHKALKKAETAQDAKNIKYLSKDEKDADDKKFTLQNGTFYEFIAYRHAPATLTLDGDGNYNGDYEEVKFFDFYSEICSGIVTNIEIGSGQKNAFTAASCPVYDTIANEVTKRVLAATNGIPNYKYSDYEMPDAVKNYYESSKTEAGVEELNATLNGLLGQYLGGGGSVDISKVVNDLLETNIKLFVGDGTGALDNVWLRLYEQPVETVFNLLPVLMIVIDEIVLPMALNSDNAYLHNGVIDDGYKDKYYNGDNGLISGALEGLGISLLTADRKAIQTKDGKVNVGTIFNTLDLNKILPSLFAFLSGDAKTAKEISGTYGDYLNKYNITNTDPVNTNVIAFTGIYVADNAIYNLDLTSNKKLDPTLAKGLTELIQEVAGFAYDATEEYLNECKADAEHKDYRYVKVEDSNTECATLQTGLNNIPVSLPKLLDKIGQRFINKYGVKSDWTLIYNGKFDSAKRVYKDATVNQTVNSPLNDFKLLAKNAPDKENATAILDAFMNAFTGTWVNGLLDLINDTLSTDNKLTSNIPLIAGLLNSLGGFGETSILTDALNGFFSLTRDDKATFTLQQQDARKGFVGLSVESGYFLISNVAYTDKNGNKKGIIYLIKDIQEANKKNPKYSTSNSNNNTNTNTNNTTNNTKKPTLVNSSKANKKYDKKTVLTGKNIKTANQLLEKLDKILASLLDNTSLNDFALNSNENILAGVLTTASNYIGEKNTNQLLTLVDEYLKVFDTTAKNGKVDADKVYSDSNLSNIVTKTYTLLENIIGYVFYDIKTGVIRGGDRYHVVASAINGIYSPDSLAVRMSSTTAANDLKGKKHWSDVKEVRFGISNGNKTDFYNALGDSLAPVGAVLGAVLTYSYTDTSHKDNLYSGVLQPVLSAIAKHTGATDVISAESWNSLDGSQKIVQGILTPLSNILTQFYKAPASFLVNLIGALGDILNDQELTRIVNNALGAVNTVFIGAKYLVGGSDMLNAPSLVKYLGNLLSSKVSIFNSNLQVSLELPEKDIIVTLLRNIKISSVNMTLGQLVALKTIDWDALAKANSTGEKLLLIFSYLVDVVLSSPVILGLVKDAAPELVKLLETLNPGQILALISAILDITQSPTEVFWTFRAYAGKLTNTFVYPKGITASEANEAVDNLDKLVQNVFPLLKDLGVLDVEDLPTLVNGLLFTNENLTKLTTAVYGGIYDAAKKAEITDLLKALGLDFSPKGVASILMDESYGKTFSSAAHSLKKAKSWKKVKTLNWGFKNGSSKAQTGFVNALAALLRPVNGVLSIFLAEGKGLDLDLDENSKSEIIKMVKTINVKKTEIGGIKDKDPYGCKLYLEIKNGVLIITVDSNASNKNSTLKLDINGVAATLVEMASDAEFGFGTNGYENAIIPLLEAFLCEDVATYDEYLADYEEAKDNLLIDVLNPIVGLVNRVLEAPANTLTAILPNLAYFIDSNGLAQAVSNLLAPITSKNGLIGILDKNGINVNKLIKQITGKSLSKVVTDALGINAKLHLDLTDLASCNVQVIVIPLVKSILKKNKINIKIPDISFAGIASHGKIVTAESAAKNSKGEYERKMVKANKGEMFVALLRYVGDVLIKNATTLNNLLGGIDAIKNNKTIKDILDCVFSSLKVATKDDIVRAVFYFLTQHGAQDSFFDYSNFVTKKYDFTFGNMDEEFCRKLAPMLDGLVGGLLADKGGLLGLIGNMAYKDDVISSIACGLYSAIDGVDLGDMGSLTALLAKTDIDFTTTNVANLLTDKRYGKSFSQPAKVIAKAGSWKNVKKEDLKWGVKDRDTFLNALVAVLRPVYGVVDVLLNNGNLNLFNVVSVPGSNGYTSFIVPLLEAFGVYNIKTQYDYRMDMEKAYDALLLDILNPLWDKVEDILNAPIEMLADILPNLSLFFANNGLLQLIDNLLTPVSALLDAVKPIINVNVVLDVLGVDVNALLGKIGIKANVKVDVYDLKGTLEPVIGSQSVVSLLNGILGTVKIGGKPLGLVLPEIDWFQLASHGKVVSTTSQVATYGTRIAVQSDQDETLIAVLRYLINTINYKDNYDKIVALVGGLLGGAGDSISGVVDQVLGMLKGDADPVIESLVELLQSIAG